jgi:hypothetical protein
MPGIPWDKRRKDAKTAETEGLLLFFEGSITVISQILNRL